jgi:hypothetical protein
MLSGGIDVLRCQINVSKLYDSEFVVMFIRVGVASAVVLMLIILSRCTT